MRKTLHLLLLLVLIASVGMTNAQDTQWYGYAQNCFGGDSWANRFVSFESQHPNVVQTSSETLPQINAATYVDGYVWFVTATRSLCKAPLDEATLTIGNYETVVPVLDQYNLVIDMAYNPLDGFLYFLCQNSQFSANLKRTPLAEPSVAELVGDFNYRFWTLAINAQGQAYGISYEGGDLYMINLDDASITLVGPTGKEVWYNQSMAFDDDNGILYWAHVATATDHGFYQVDTQTGEATRLGDIGEGGAQLTGLFMVAENTIPEPELISEIHVEGFTVPVWGEHPDYELSVDPDAPYSLTDLAWHWVEGLQDPVVAPEEVFNDEEKAYYLATKFTPQSGFAFADEVRVYYDGDDSLFELGTVFGDDYLAYTIDFHVVNTTGLAEPSINDLEGMEGKMVRVYDLLGRMVLREPYCGSFQWEGLGTGVFVVNVGGRSFKVINQ